MKHVLLNVRFSFGPGVKNLRKTGPGSGVTFPFQQ